MLINILQEGVRRMKPNSFQWCPATGQRVTGTNWSISSSVWRRGRTSRVTELPRVVMDSPCLEILKIRLDEVLYNLLQVTLLCQGDWTRWSPEVHSSPYHSVILWKSPSWSMDFGSWELKENMVIKGFYHVCLESLPSYLSFDVTPKPFCLFSHQMQDSCILKLFFLD